MSRWFGRRHDADDRNYTGRKPRGGFKLESLESRQLLSVSPMASPEVNVVQDEGYLAADIQAYDNVWTVDLSMELTCHQAGSGDAPVDTGAEENQTPDLIVAENQAPQAGDDAFSLLADQQVGGSVAGNDSDPDGDAIQAVLATGPAHGTLNLREDGRFVYTPEAGYSGSDSFTYTVTDGQAASNPATVTFQVTLENQAPTAADDAYTTLEGQPIAIAADTGVLANDADADGDALSAVLVDPPASGTVILRDDGSLEYTPQEGFSGIDTFTYTASDGQGQSAPATVSVTVEAVNEIPQATDDAYTTGEDQPLAVEASGVLANDADADGDALSAVLVEGPLHGEVNLAADGSFVYTPAADYTGTDAFTYLAGDGQAESNVATVTIDIQAMNDLPQSQDDAYSVAEDEVLTVDASGVLANDADAEGDALSAVLVEGPASGTLTLSGDGSFQYTPNADFQGTDSFTYRAADAEGNSEIATVTITVEAMNDVPAAQDDAYTTLENVDLAVEPGSLLANDTDADGDALSAMLVEGAAHGTVTVGEDGSFYYTPEAGFSGTDTFRYVARDAEGESNVATVTVTVSAANELPAAADDAYETYAGQVLAVEPNGVLANDTDADGDALTASIVDVPASGTVTLAADGSFEYTPAEGFTGTDTFTYETSDGSGVSNLATVTVNVLPSQQQSASDVGVTMTVSATPFGSEITGNWAGSTFWVNVYVEDLRELPQGVVGGAIDVAFDTAQATPTGQVVYGDAFTEFQQGTADDAGGMIDEAGALAASTGAGSGAVAGFVSYEFQLDSVAGQVQFASEAGEGTSTITPAQFALVGQGTAVDWANVEFGSASLSFNRADFNGDGAVNQFDLALWLGHVDTAAGDAGYDALYDLTGDEQISGGDRDILLASMFGGQAAEQTADPAPEAVSGEGVADALELAWVDSEETDDASQSEETQATDLLFQSETDWA